MNQYEYILTFLTDEGSEFSLKIPRGNKTITAQVANAKMESIIAANAFDLVGSLQYKMSADLMEMTSREITLTN